MARYLENDAIILRALEPEDLSFLYACENNTNAWGVTSTMVPFSKYVLKQYLENAHLDIYTSKQLRLIIALKEQDGRAIGAIDLFEFDPYNSRAGVGIIINEEGDRGKGYASMALDLLKSYAFKHLKLNQLYCHVGVDNLASIALFQAAGFKQTGVHEQWKKTTHGYIDVNFYQCFK